MQGFNNLFKFRDGSCSLASFSRFKSVIYFLFSFYQPLCTLDFLISYIKLLPLPEFFSYESIAVEIKIRTIQVAEKVFTSNKGEKFPFCCPSYSEFLLCFLYSCHIHDALTCIISFVHFLFTLLHWKSNISRGGRQFH